MTYEEACDFLFGLPSWSRDGAYHPGLTRVNSLLAGLDSPHTRYPVVHVAGTNGKGSVCAMVAAMVSAAGHRVGLHTSPHIFSFAERMRVDGVEAPQDWIAATTERLAPSIREHSVSFFEASTAMALLYFAECEVELGVVEVGMGGRLDATNIVRPEVSVITNIGLDHTEHLGTTLEEIAAEKAGIIKSGVPVVSGCCQTEVRAVIRAKAELAGSQLFETCDDENRLSPDRFELDLGGEHQRRNASVAVAAIEVLKERVPTISADISTGLLRTRQLSGLRGRCQILSTKPLIVADVAHNAEGIEAALKFVERVGNKGDRIHVLLSLAADKDVGSVLDVLFARDVTMIAAELEHPRLIDAADLAQQAREKGLRNVEIASPERILSRFRETSASGIGLLATGSHLLVGSLPRALFEETKPE